MTATTADVEVPGTEIELPPAAPITLFGTTDPRLALARMSDVAKVLVDVVREQKLSVRIQGREHLHVEAWTTLGGMLGIIPVVVWTRPNETGDGFVARVEARRVFDDRVVGAAEAECSRVEKVWKDRYPYSLRAMAQTRATSRALRMPLGQIVVLAGYDPAGAEEMPTDTAGAGSEPGGGRIPPEHRPTGEQGIRLRTLLATLGEIDPERDWQTAALELAGIPDWQHATATIVENLIEKLEERLAA